MSWTAPKTWNTGDPIPKADLDTHVRDNLNFLKVNIALGVPTNLTVALGIVVKTQSHHTITSAAGVTDDLDTINGGTDGDVIYLRAVAGHTITLKHGTGNIYSSTVGDVDITDSIYAEGIYNGTNWCVKV